MITVNCIFEITDINFTIFSDLAIFNVYKYIYFEKSVLLSTSDN